MLDAEVGAAEVDHALGHARRDLEVAVAIDAARARAGDIAEVLDEELVRDVVVSDLGLSGSIR